MLGTVPLVASFRLRVWPNKGPLAEPLAGRLARERALKVVYHERSKRWSNRAQNGSLETLTMVY